MVGATEVVVGDVTVGVVGMPRVVDLIDSFVLELSRGGGDFAGDSLVFAVVICPKCTRICFSSVFWTL